MTLRLKSSVARLPPCPCNGTAIPPRRMLAVAPQGHGLDWYHGAHVYMLRLFKAVTGHDQSNIRPCKGRIFDRSPGTFDR